MGKFIDINLRNETELKRLERKIRQVVSTLNCNIGEISFFEVDGKPYIHIENDGAIGSYLAGVFSSSQLIKKYEIFEQEGWYEWKENIYVRPSTQVSIEF